MQSCLFLSLSSNSKLGDDANTSSLMQENGISMYRSAHPFILTETASNAFQSPQNLPNDTKENHGCPTNQTAVAQATKMAVAEKPPENAYGLKKRTITNNVSSSRYNNVLPMEASQSQVNGYLTSMTRGGHLSKMMTTALNENAFPAKQPETDEHMKPKNE